MLSVTAVGLGLGVVAAATIGRLGTSWASFASTATLWASFAAAIAYAFVRGRPAGLLRFRPIDLLWGVGVGLGLRALEGWLSGSLLSAFPTAGTLDGTLPADWWWATALPGGLVGPLVEEFLFRAVILVAIFQAFRRWAGQQAAGITALMTSAGVFVLLHAAFTPTVLADGMQLFLVGVVCSLAVLLTGRIWGAVLIHMVYNVSFLLLVVVGTSLS